MLLTYSVLSADLSPLPDVGKTVEDPSQINHYTYILEYLLETENLLLQEERTNASQKETEIIRCFKTVVYSSKAFILAMGGRKQEAAVWATFSLRLCEHVVDGFNPSFISLAYTLQVFKTLGKTQLLNQGLALIPSYSNKYPLAATMLQLLMRSKEPIGSTEISSTEISSTEISSVESPVSVPDESHSSDSSPLPDEVASPRPDSEPLTSQNVAPSEFGEDYLGLSEFDVDVLPPLPKGGINLKPFNIEGMDPIYSTFDRDGTPLELYAIVPGGNSADYNPYDPYNCSSLL